MSSEKRKMLAIKLTKKYAKKGVVLSGPRFLKELNKKFPKFYIKNVSKLNVRFNGIPHHLEPTYPKIRSEIEKLYSDTKKWQYERYCLLYGVPKCIECGSKEGKLFNNLRTKGSGAIAKLYNFCSESCSKSSIQAFEKRRRTVRAKYRCDNVSQNKRVMEKITLWSKDPERVELRNSRTIKTLIIICLLC